MITLKTSSPFAHGGHREVYRHPEREDRCLKVMVEDWKSCDVRMRASWLSRHFRSKRHFHESLKEWHFSEAMRRRRNDLIWKFVAQAHGMVATDLGEALEVELVRDHDGSISPSLRAYLYRNGMTPGCRDAIESFWTGVVRHRIFVQGRPDNLSMQSLGDGSFQLVAIDGFGLAQIVPLAKWFPGPRHHFFEKRRTKQQKEIERILTARSDQVDIGSKGFVD